MGPFRQVDFRLCRYTKGIGPVIADATVRIRLRHPRKRKSRFLIGQHHFVRPGVFVLLRIHTYLDFDSTFNRVRPQPNRY